MAINTCHICGSTDGLIALGSKPVCESCAHSIITRAAALQRRDDELLARAERDISEGRGPTSRPLMPARRAAP